MIKRFAAAIAASLLILAGSMTIGAPAQAAFGGTCAANSFCLYPWTGLGAPVAGDRWQSSISNIANHTDGGVQGCLNLGSATWNNGTPVNDNAASAMVNMTSTGNHWAYYTLDTYNWANCNAAGQSGHLTYLPDGHLEGWDNLNNEGYDLPAGTTMKMYHTITSIRVRCPSC